MYIPVSRVPALAAGETPFGGENSYLEVAPGMIFLLMHAAPDIRRQTVVACRTGRVAQVVRDCWEGCEEDECKG